MTKKFDSYTRTKLGNMNKIESSSTQSSDYQMI